MEFFYVDPCERAVPWAGRKEDTNKFRDQTSDVIHLTLDICHLSFVFTSSLATRH